MHNQATCIRLYSNIVNILIRGAVVNWTFGILLAISLGIHIYIGIIPRFSQLLNISQ
jgi:hypothetical protein